MISGDQIDFLQQREAPEARPYTPTPVRGERGMQQVTREHEESDNEEKRALVLRLQRRAHELWKARQLAISVNDVRPLLREWNYGGDPRVLSAAFPRGEWVAVGYTRTDSTLANARDVRTFVPREAYAWWRANTQEGREYQPRRRSL
jgi:hypothetical protein